MLKGERMTEKPNVTLPGRVEKIIKSTRPTEPEKAEISVEAADTLYREIRISRRVPTLMLRLKLKRTRQPLKVMGRSDCE
jgi:hypothetical protein